MGARQRAEYPGKTRFCQQLKLSRGCGRKRSGAIFQFIVSVANRDIVPSSKKEKHSAVFLILHLKNNSAKCEKVYSRFAII